MITNKKHQIFAEEYILSNDAIASYQKAYPKAGEETARVQSYRLVQNHTIADYIKTKQLEIQNARQNNLVEQLKTKDSSNILNREKIVEMQSNVVKLTYNKFIKTKDKADAEVFNKSVAVYNKLEGLDKPTKTENTNIELKQPIFGEYSLDAE